MLIIQMAKVKKCSQRNTPKEYVLLLLDVFSHSLGSDNNIEFERWCDWRLGDGQTAHLGACPTWPHTTTNTITSITTTIILQLWEQTHGETGGHAVVPGGAQGGLVGAVLIVDGVAVQVRRVAAASRRHL